MKNTTSQEVNGYMRYLTLKPPFDKRNPNPKKDYGIHGMDLIMVLSKNNKAVEFSAFLPVHLTHVVKELALKKDCHFFFEGMGANVGYHSPYPIYENQYLHKDCRYIGCDCYCNGSSLRADEWYQVFLKEGVDKIWEMLESYWLDMFSAKNEEK